MDEHKRHGLIAFISVTVLFFGWGFITSNNDPLLTALKSIFHLNWTEALLTQIVSFAANGFLALPAAAMLNRIGAVKAILVALGAMFMSCLLMQLATEIKLYGAILFSLFIMASGITALQVAANPLIANLGKPEHSHFRLTWAQTFNSLGVVIGVHFGSKLLLSNNLSDMHEVNIPNLMDKMPHLPIDIGALESVEKAFIIIGLIILSMMLIINSTSKYINETLYQQIEEDNGNVLAALKSKWAIFGAIAIGLYVGAEVSIGSVMINFLNQSNILGLQKVNAGNYLANYYWGGALLGRMIGSALLTRMRVYHLLMGAGFFATLLCLITAIFVGPISGYASLGVGFFNSIMFPTIFTLTLERAKVPQSATSGLLCLAISGGAILPYLFGVIADSSNLNIAFYVPLAAYSFIAVFAYCAMKSKSTLA